MGQLSIEEANKIKAFIPFSTMLKVWDAKNKGKISIYVPDKSLDTWRKKWDEYNYKFNILLPKCAELNNKGTEYEKAGNIQEAIQVYEQNIFPDCYPAHHAYDRLLILYRKQKDYENELRVCQLAINTFKSNRQKYKERLRKIKILISKQKS